MTANAFAFDPILRGYQSIRSLGMGGVRFTTGLYEDNFYGNPARVTANPAWRFSIFDVSAATNSAALKNATHASSAGGNTYQKIADTAGDNNYFKLQSAMPALYLPHLGRWALGIGILTATEANVGLQRSYRIDPIAVTEIGPAFTLGRRFFSGDALSVGITLRTSYRLATRRGFGFTDFIQTGELKAKTIASDGIGYDTNLGVTYRLPNVHYGFEYDFGFSMNQLFGGRFNQVKSGLIGAKTVSGLRSFPRTLNFGVSATRPSLLHFFQDVVLAAEMTDIGNNDNGSVFRLVHFGAESKVLKIFKLRAGLNQGWMSAGLGIKLLICEIDLSTWGEELTYNAGGLEDRRFGLRIGFFL